MKILPPAIPPNGVIGMIAPADPVEGVFRTADKLRGYAYLGEKGLTVKEGRSMQSRIGHTAGSIDVRVKDIHEFFLDPGVHCIMAFWGGNNSNQLLDFLDYDLIASHPKVFIGYSDTTALTCAITKMADLVTFSGPGGVSFAKPMPFDYTWKGFESVCIRGEDNILFKASDEYADDAYYLRENANERILKKNEGLRVYQKAAAEGEIVAGNLQTLLVLAGTKYFPDLREKILFIEEEENASAAMVDRWMTQAAEMGIFDVICGLVIGRFATQTGFTEQDPFTSVLERVVRNPAIPVLYNADFGHTDPLMTLPNGGTCRIDGSRIIFHTAVTLP